MTLTTLPLWLLCLIFVVGVAIAALTICIEEFRDEWVIPAVLFVTGVKFMVEMGVLFLVIIQRIF